MITQTDIDALRRIKEHCISREDCEGCVLDTGEYCPCAGKRAEFWQLDNIKPDDITYKEAIEAPMIPAVDPLTQRIDSLEATVKELAGALVETNRKLAATDNYAEKLAKKIYDIKPI